MQYAGSAHTTILGLSIPIMFFMLIELAITPALIVSGSLMLMQFIRGRKFINIRYWKYALAFNIPLLPYYLSGTIQNQGDHIMIQKMLGKSEVAIYSIAYNIGMLIWKPYSIYCGVRRMHLRRFNLHKMNAVNEELVI